uniref:Palmitoyltransferase n=1 Tax=Taenia asiatica TaxID=60517 RepID=A0A0R3W4J2_TAEAS
LESIITSRGLPIETTNDVGMIRVCPTCSLIKPDRCHHCSTCEWYSSCDLIDNCVGFHNYKYFVVFLLWGFLYCLYIVCTTVVYFIDFWQNLQDMPPARYNFLFLFFIAIMFGFAQSILLFYHFYLLSRNRTTLEGFRSPTFRGSGVDKRGFDLGWLQNWQEVFGDNVGLALVPVFTRSVPLCLSFFFVCLGPRVVISSHSAFGRKQRLIIQRRKPVKRLGRSNVLLRPVGLQLICLTSVYVDSSKFVEYASRLVHSSEF